MCYEQYCRQAGMDRQNLELQLEPENQPGTKRAGEGLKKSQMTGKPIIEPTKQLKLDQ